MQIFKVFGKKFVSDNVTKNWIIERFKELRQRQQIKLEPITTQIYDRPGASISVVVGTIPLLTLHEAMLPADNATRFVSAALKKEINRLIKDKIKDADQGIYSYMVDFSYPIRGRMFSTIFLGDTQDDVATSASDWWSSPQEQRKIEALCNGYAG